MISKGYIRFGMAISCVFSTSHLDDWPGRNCKPERKVQLWKAQLWKALKLATATGRREFRRQQPRLNVLGRIECIFTKSITTWGYCDISSRKPTSFPQETLPSRERRCALDTEHLYSSIPLVSSSTSTSSSPTSLSQLGISFSSSSRKPSLAWAAFLTGVLMVHIQDRNDGSHA